MVTIERINGENLDFPSTEQALSYPNGLLAVGGDLSVGRLLHAYRRGIFPWYEDPQPILWWSPDPRSVLYPEELNISRSLRKTMRKDSFVVSSDTAFHRVLSGCAAPRERERGTWITNAMGRAYMELHRSGYAHSIEVWNEHRQLIGGLYGVALGRVFFGESMFSRASDASKIALVALRRLMREHDLDIIDCQVESAHLNSMGARNIPRLDFERFLAHTDPVEESSGKWALELCSGALL
jgi:leucyl/phenylalanyl-tRNA--protein transferase